MSGRATFATARFRLATAATRISARRTRPARAGAVDAGAAPVGSRSPDLVAIAPSFSEESPRSIQLAAGRAGDVNGRWTSSGRHPSGPRARDELVPLPRRVAGSP